MSQYDDAGFDVGDDLDQAVGLQHAELVADLQDKPFFQECLISGPFGTVDNPVKIESVLGYRIVGCTGAEPRPNPCIPPTAQGRWSRVRAGLGSRNVMQRGQRERSGDGAGGCTGKDCERPGNARTRGSARSVARREGDQPT